MKSKIKQIQEDDPIHDDFLPSLQIEHWSRFPKKINHLTSIGVTIVSESVLLRSSTRLSRRNYKTSFCKTLIKENFIYSIDEFIEHNWFVGEMAEKQKKKRKYSSKSGVYGDTLRLFIVAAYFFW